jgi:hypothetical protein
MNCYSICKNTDFDDNLLIKSSNILNGQRFLLNRVINNNLLEQFIYRTAKYHIDSSVNLNDVLSDNLSQSHTDPFIEFMFYIQSESEIADNITHYENPHDKYIGDAVNKPNISTITFLNHSNITFITTNLNPNNYKFKNINNNNIAFALHTKMNHVKFNCNNMYGFSNLNLLSNNDISNSSTTLMINIWNEKPNIPIFSYDIFSYQYLSTYREQFPTLASDNLISICKNSDQLFRIQNNNTPLIENMLYNNDKQFVSIIYETFNANGIINNLDQCAGIILTNANNDVVKDNILNDSICNKDSGGKDILNVINKPIDVLDDDKFKQLFIIPNVLDENVCKWIILEYNNYAINNNGWAITHPDASCTTSLSLECIPIILNLLLEVFRNLICNEIKKKYFLNDDCLFNIIDLTIIKNDIGQNIEYQRRCNGSEINAYIALNNTPCYQAGIGISCNNNFNILPNIGDMVIATDRHSHINLNLCQHYICFSLNIGH